MKATILDLRYRMKDVLKAVQRGETVTVLYRGKPAAKITPLATKPDSESLTQDPTFGMWRDREDMRDTARYVRELRRGRLRDL